MVSAIVGLGLSIGKKLLAKKLGGGAQKGAGLLGGILGARAAKKAAKESAKLMDKSRQITQDQIAENDRWWNVKQAEDYTQRADVQNMVNTQRQMLMEQSARNKAANTVMGGTDEALALQNESMNQAVAQMGSDIAAQANSAKDSYEQQYRAQDAALNNQLAQSYQQQAQQVAQAGSQAANAGTQFMGTMMAGKKTV